MSLLHSIKNKLFLTSADRCFLHNNNDEQHDVISRAPHHGKVVVEFENKSKEGERKIAQWGQYGMFNDVQMISKTSK